MDASIVAQFALATLLPAVATAILTSLRRNKLHAMGYWPWQILCGVIFGIIAIMGTEFGITLNGATMNVRDAAPITAGLFFGGPAGIIAGIMGGVERWFSVYWGRGMFTRVACSIATCAAGFYAALLRKYVFEDRKPSWPLACATGVVAEVLHLLLVFLTNPESTTQAFVVVRACTVPMIGCNGIATTLSALASQWASGHKLHERVEVRNITQVVQLRLLVVVLVGFVASAWFTNSLQRSLSASETNRLLSLALADVQADISKASDDNLLGLTYQAAAAIPELASASQETIDALIEDLDVAEVHVVDTKGIIVASSDQRYVGFDMGSGEQSAEFLMLLPGGGAAQLVQSYQPISYDNSVWRKYAGVRISDGFVQVGYDSSQFLDDLSSRVNSSVRNRRVGQDGAIVVISQDGSLVGTRADIVMDDEDVAALLAATEAQAERTVFVTEFLGDECYASYREVEGFKLVALQPVEEAEMGSRLSALVMAYMEVLVLASLFVAVYLLIRNEVVRNIWKVNGTLGKITKGDLEAEVAVEGSAEFISLSRDINSTVDSLRKAIAAEAARFNRELDYARRIQESALPRAFPPFPEIDSFDIYAQMDPAREVGGDFYDFFLMGEHTLGFLIADVSGKGIPASLFMMAAKAELSNYMSSGMPLADAVQTANWHLCQGNDAGMFVTVWAATFDFETGELTYVNAGHNPPLLRHDGTWQWLRQKSGLFLGTFDTARYRSHTLTLVPGDELLLYTDGVNEAFSVDDVQYGDDRLEAFLSAHAQLHPRPLADALRADLARWAEGAEQSDDITMLALEYGVAPQATGILTVPATLDQLESVFDFIHGALRDRSCPLGTQNQLDVIIEELFVNVCNYAYVEAEEPGTVTIEYIYNANPSAITVSMCDTGVPFDPLTRSDPTKPESIEEANIGGLGIYMVKRLTDDLSYIRDGDTNVVAFVKGW